MTPIEDNATTFAINNFLVQTVSRLQSTRAIALPATRSHSGRRVIAACAYDYLFCFWSVTAIMHIADFCFHFHNESAALIRVLAFVIFLSRDYFNRGQGFGKWLLRLRTVDSTTLARPTILQSVKRNLVLVIPYFLCEATVYLQDHSLISFSFAAILVAAETICLCRGAGLRVADRWAGTVVVNEPQ